VDIIKLIRKAAPWTDTQAKLTATAFKDLSWPLLTAAVMRVLPKGAVRSKGYAGNTQIGVIV
jgi:hypothetical protein